MPEYHIDTSLDRDRWNCLDAFTQGYIEAAFFTEYNADNAELEDARFNELSQTALATIVAECQEFQEANKALLLRAYEIGAYNETRAGNDFWFTRNGHGTGFWDRGLGAIGDQLAKVARYSERYLYRGDDDMVHIN